MLRLGILAYGISFLAYGIYLFGALATHVQDVLVDPSTRKNKMFVTINTGVFVFFLLLFGALSLING